MYISYVHCVSMFSSTRLAGLALCLAATLASLAPTQVAASRGRGLTQFYDSTFYRNLDKHRFYRKNVNNLDALLKVVVNGPIVSTTVLNRGYKEFAAVSVSITGWVWAVALRCSAPKPCMPHCCALRKAYT